MTGLPVEQILGIGKLDQGAQQLRNQSAATISDATYRQALAETGRMNAATEQQRVQTMARLKTVEALLQSQREAAMNAKDYALAARYEQELSNLQQAYGMYEKGTHPTQISAGAAARKAATGERTEDRKTAEYLLDEEKHQVNTKIARDQQKLAEMRTEAYIDNLESLGFSRADAAEKRRVDIINSYNNWVNAFMDYSLADEERSIYGDALNNEMPMDATRFYHNHVIPGWGTNRGFGAHQYKYGKEVVTKADILEIMEDQKLTFNEVLNMLAILPENR